MSARRWKPPRFAVSCALACAAGLSAEQAAHARPLFNVLGEAVRSLDDNGVSHTAAVTLSPGFRAGWNLGEERQIVVGGAVPTTVSADETSVAVLGYFSYELPFPTR